MAEIKRVNHIDNLQNEWMTEKFTDTEEGFLRGRAIVTNIGVFSYLDDSGNVRRELRLPEEVFARESIESLKMKPITNTHPTEKVTSDNLDKYQKGFCGDSVEQDAFAMSVPITITDKETIKEIKEGKRSLSCGYEADIEYKSGNWMGVHYDAIQRNIRYNHIAIVDSGRAGDLAKIRMDNSSVGRQNTEKKENGMELKKLVLDGVEYSAEAKVIETIHNLKSDVADKEKLIKDATDEKSRLNAEKDAIQAKLDEAINKVEELKKLQLDDSKIQEAIKERLSVMDSAKELGADVTADMSVVEMKKTTIAKVLPKLDLADKDDIYISAMFDACGEMEFARVTVDNAPKQDNSQGEQRIDVSQKRKEYIERLQSEYKGGK